MLVERVPLGEGLFDVREADEIHLGLLRPDDDRVADSHFSSRIAVASLVVHRGEKP